MGLQCTPYYGDATGAIHDGLLDKSISLLSDTSVRSVQLVSNEKNKRGLHFCNTCFSAETFTSLAI